MLPQLVIPGLRWIGAVRPAECPASIAAWQRDEGGQRLAEISLAPLGESAVRELFDARAAWHRRRCVASALARHTGGNPFFVLQTLNALVETGGADLASNRLPTPTSVGALIERRLGQLLNSWRREAGPSGRIARR